MARAMCAPVRRTAADRCPGAVALHDAEDGGLARVRVPGGRLTAAQLRALVEAVGLGSGLADLTSRANVQVRGLDARDASRLAEVLAGAGLLPSAEHDRARNVLASPLGGRGADAVAATDGVVADLDALLCAEDGLASLPGKFLFAVDDGSGVALDQRADVALVAEGEGVFRLALAGRPTTLVGGAALAVEAARAFLDVRGASHAWRIAELEDGPPAVAARLGAELESDDLPRGEPLAPGVTRQRDGRAAVTALVPLGRLDASVLAALAELAAEARIGTARTVTLVDVEDLESVRAGLRDAGLVLSARSGWTGLSACAGLGACPRARFDVRAAAARRALVREADGGAEHWAACERRCGERAGLTVSVFALGDLLHVRAGAREATVADADAAMEVLA